MSSPLQSPHTHQSDVVIQNPNSQISNTETLYQPEFETLAPSLDREDNNSPEVEPEDDDDEERLEDEYTSETQSMSSGMHLYAVPSITEPHVSVHEATLKSPSTNRNPRLVGLKRKKGKGKGKSNIKKQLAMEVKLQTLMSKLNPFPFIPVKILDFAKHEALLKKLGLWDFVHIDFDRDIRVDLVAQLVVTYEAKSRASYVNGFRVMVNRADLARAFKFPVKKEKGNVGGMELDLDMVALTEDSIGFIVEIVTDWMLLHEDIWMMPNEVVNWIQVIKDGHPERVDWAGLVWFMVEKELTQGARLRNCYYASHLQYLIKSQREGLFLPQEPITEALVLSEEAKEEHTVELCEEAKEEHTVELCEEAKEEHTVELCEGSNEEDEVGERDVNVIDPIEETGEKSCLMVGPNTELTLGQDGEKEEETKDDEEKMDIEKCNESDEDDGEEEQGQWVLHGKSDIGEHFMQRCSAEDNVDFGSFDERKEEEMQEDEDEDEVLVFPNDDTLEPEGITGNLLQAMEDNQIAFSSEQDIITADMPPTSSFYNNMGKRVIDHENDNVSHHALLDSNKRLRMNDLWDHKPVDFVTCMEQIQQMAQRAKMCYDEKENGLAQSNMNQQILLDELQKRDTVIEHLHKIRLEEVQKKDGEIYRLERELYLMGTVLDGYRKALKETQKVFAEYREKARIREEPTYKDAGPGGLMMSTSDIEKLRKKQEEEFRMNCLVIEHKMKEVEEGYVAQFGGIFEKVKNLENKLIGIEANGKELIELYNQRKIVRIDEEITRTEEQMHEVEKRQLIEQTEEKVAEKVAEALLNE